MGSTYALSQVRALCHVQRTSCMGAQHAHRVVVKKNTTTEDMYNTTEEKHRVQKARQIKLVATCTNLHKSS